MDKKEKREVKKLTPLQKQIITAIVFGSICIVVISFILYQITSSPGIAKKEEEEGKKGHISQIETVGDKVDAQETWRYKMQEKNEEIKKEIDYIKAALVKNMEGSRQNKEEKESEEKIREVDPVVTQLKQEILNLREMIGGVTTTQVKTDEPQMELKPITIKKIKLNLIEKPKVKIKNKDDTIAAGSFARAVLLAGVDASTSLTSSADPRPLLIRLIDHGTLPRKFQSDLKDCHIVASGYGDLSSERVFVRLEKLTCVARRTGEVIETEVAGYVTGEDGRAGIRGEVIEKGRGYLAKSVVGGVLQGVAGVFQPTQPTVVNPVGAFIPKRSHEERFGEGLTAGASGSMDRLSKYYIERAESIQPVIQVASGRIVDVIFTEGGDIGTQDIAKKIEKNNKMKENKNEW